MTIKLPELIESVLLPAQKEVLSGFDEVTAIHTICDEILAEEDVVAETDLIDRINELLEPIRDYLQNPQADSLKDRIALIFRESNRGGLFNRMPDGTIRYTPNGKEYVEYHRHWNCFQNFMNLVHEVNKLRNLI